MITTFGPVVAEAASKMSATGTNAGSVALSVQSVGTR
jgi:hypothetical protein|eukprot:COSAG02_NODE_59122_length_275_cov_0.590909_1_plen_36_part_10